MKYHPVLKAALGLGVAFLSISSASATTLYSNMGTTGTSYSAGQDYNVTGASIGQAVTFFAASTGTLGDIYVPLAGVGPDATDILLETNASNQPSGTVLESWSVTLPTATPASSLVDLNSTLGLTLTQGVRYWLVAENGSSSSDGTYWAFSTQAAGGYYHQSTPGGTFGETYDQSPDQGIFVVTPSASTPEPAGFLLAGAGLMGIAALRRLASAVRR